MSQLDFVAKVKIEPDTSGFRSQLNRELKEQTPRAADDVRARSQARLNELRDMKARSLVAQAQIQATENLSGSYTRLADKQVIVGKGASQMGGFLSGATARLGLMGLAATAIYQGLGLVSDRLKVAGIEAGTSAGRFRNFTASLIQGDLSGVLKAVRSEASFTSEELENLGGRAAFAGGKVELAGYKAAASALGWKKLAEQVKAVEVSLIALSSQRAQEYIERRIDSVAAYNRISTEAAEARVFGERSDEFGRGPGAAAARDRESRQADAKKAEEEREAQKKAAAESLAAARRLKDANAPRAIIDSVSNAQRTKGLQDDIAAAKQEEKYFTDRLKTVEEGTARYTQINQQLTQAITRRQGLEDQLQAQVDAAADAKADKQKAAAAEAQARRDEQKRLRDEQARLAAEEYRNDLQFQEELLNLSLRRAGLTEKTVKDDITAEKKIVAFLKAQSENKKLTKEERRNYLIRYKNEQIDLAELRKRTSTSSGSGGFTLTQFMTEVGNNYARFGSNIAPRGGVLSPQDARGAFSGMVTQGQDPSLQVQTSALTQAQQQTKLLEGIYGALVNGRSTVMGGIPAQRGTRGSFVAVEEARRLGHHLVVG